MDPHKNNNYEQEIDLKDLMFSVLRKWRLILMVAIAFAALLGGYKIVKGLNQLSDAEYVKTNQETYDTSIKQYENTKSRLEKEVNNIQDSIKEQQTYKEKSILMNINPYDEYVASTTLYIETDYRIMPQMVYQNPNSASSVLKAYMSIAQNGEMYNFVLSKMQNNIGIRYLKELVKLEPDYNNNMLSIKVVGASQKQANDVMALIMESIDHASATITESIGEHDISVVENSEYATVDMELEQQQKAFSDTMQQLDNSLTEKTQVLKDLKEPINSLLSKRTVVVSAAKYVILGGVLGAFMMVFFVCVAFLMSDNLSGDKELRRRYGVMILGTFKRKGKKKVFAFVDRWLDNLDGTSGRELEDSQTFEVAAANLTNYVEDAKSILLVGSVEQSELERVRNGLISLLPSLSLAVGGNICKSAQAIKETASCDAVVIVEQRGKSSFGNMEQELELVYSLNKKVLGFIVL